MAAKDVFGLKTTAIWSVRDHGFMLQRCQQGQVRHGVRWGMEFRHDDIPPLHTRGAIDTAAKGLRAA